MLRIVFKWVLYATALMMVAYVLPGISVQSFGAALAAAAVIGLLNTIVRPILVVLTLPVTVLTVGLFLLVINALMFWLAGSMLSGFAVGGFWWAFAGALIYSVLGMAIDSVTESLFAKTTQQ